MTHSSRLTDRAPSQSSFTGRAVSSVCPPAVDSAFAIGRGRAFAGAAAARLNPTEPDRTDPHRTEPSRTEFARTESGHTRIRRAGQSKEFSMGSRRTAKVAEAVREQVATTILFGLKDPRVKNVTVTRVEVSPDLRSAKVYVSVMGDEKMQRLTLHGLQSARGFLQAKLAERVQIRYTPILHFELDQGVKKSIEASRLLREVLPPPAETDDDDSLTDADPDLLDEEADNEEESDLPEDEDAAALDAGATVLDSAARGAASPEAASPLAVHQTDAVQRTDDVRTDAVHQADEHQDPAKANPQP
jgi:ribosome-binding factor A